MPYVTAKDGTRLHVKDMGTGKPVILIHGWPLSGDMWERQTLALLEGGYRVITYDRRGFGLSGHPIEGYDYDVLADDLAAILDERQIKDATLVGFSMGGGEVARYLSRHGTERVAKTVLIGAVLPFLLKTRDNPEGIDSSVLDGLKQQIRQDRFAFLQEFGPAFYGHDTEGRATSRGVLDWSFLLACMASPMATLSCVDAWGRTDFRRDLEAFTVPTLVIHGSEDDTVPPQLSGRKTASLIRHAIYREYEGAGHGLFITYAERLNRDLLTFLAD